MSKKRSESAVIDLSWLTILAFTDPKVAAWGEVRAAQKDSYHRLGLLRLMMALVSVAALFVIFRNTVPPLQRFAATGIIVMFSVLRQMASARRQRQLLKSVSSAELHADTYIGTIAGAIWGSIAIVYGAHGTVEQMFLLWAIYACMLSGAAFGLNAIPLATVMFVLMMGGGLGASLLWRHDYYAAAITGAYVVSMIIVTLVYGRRFIEHRYAAYALTEKTEVVSMLLREYEDSGGDWMWQTDVSKCLTHISPRFARQLGVDPDMLESKPLLQILAGDTWDAGNFSAGLRELAEKLKNRESFSDLVIPITVNNELHWWELSASPRFDEKGQFLGFHGVGSDVSEAHRSADKINRMARFDTLTGLPNRLHVNEALAQTMHESKRWNGRCGFLMIDLDRFKAVNDTLGHPVGDRLLTAVAERLSSIMTPNELCGRLGGDEFAVVVREVRDPGYLTQIGQQIIETFSAPYEIDHNTLFVGASVGTALGPRDGRSVEALVRSADLALYRSKDMGGNVVVAFESNLHQQAEERRVLELALRRAVENNEFHLHYQPVVSARNGDLMSFEALLRWTSPDLGVVSPGKFIPIAEEARLISAIGEWALRTACIEAAQWPSRTRVAVNVSAEQLINANFIPTLMSALAQSGLPPERLELEVTESVFMNEGSTAVKALERIIGLGVRLALDDFGTGYSSLGYLSKTKFSTIKVDRSFVQGASRGRPECLAIIRAVVALATSLGISTTAEGVETEEEQQLITELGCQKIQGYLFGRPMPASEARKLFVHRPGARAA